MFGLILFILLLVVLAVAGGLGVFAPAATGLVYILLGVALVLLLALIVFEVWWRRTLS